ncbi:TrmH family RNA methyltransferase [Aquimarina hainanensis]|uniref:tRNA (guanosine(18)-2'-O)-methyltransferase n=1 Tax=Aquimarina hainanensis TaxID=1578017 RepID=A0ABW5NFQ0_9FLAO
MINHELLEYLESFLTPRRLALYKEVLEKRTNHFTVAVEDVYQLHNTSAVIRSCDVFGIQNIHVVEEVNKKNIDREIAMGAQKWVDINRYTSVKECIANLKKQGYQIVATTPHEHAATIQHFDVTKRAAIFFGSELRGLSDEVIQKADSMLHIPMYGFTESLNISVSAAIILQYLSGEMRSNKEINWQLTEEEKCSLRMQWAKNTVKSYEQIIQRFDEDQKK